MEAKPIRADQPGEEDFSQRVDSQLVGIDPWFDRFAKGMTQQFAPAGLYPPPVVGNLRNG